MDIITQGLFGTFLDFCLNNWRLETLTILILIIAIYFIHKYKIKLTRKEIVLSFLCLLLIYINFFFVFINNRQEEIIKTYQEAITKYNEKLDLIHEEIQISKILIETQNAENQQNKLIKALEQYFQGKHKN